MDESNSFIRDNSRITLCSPLTKYPILGNHLSVNFYIKRDDLLPEVGGGNKVRKLAGIFEHAREIGCDAVVTTGGTQSNHARVAALLAATLGWQCALVLHGNPGDLNNPQGNLLLMRLTSANIKIVAPSEIAKTMQAAIKELKQQGFTPYEISGGGHCLKGTLAYVDAVNELEAQCRQINWYPDWIIHASGTGTTQAGIMAGLDVVGWPTRVVGVSVARRNPRGATIVEQAYEEVCTELGVVCQTNRVDFRDMWVGQGYEKADEKVFSAIRFAGQAGGIVLDPTYTGKAFAALIDLVHSGEIEPDSNVLFWHTGGLLNLIATNYKREILQL